MVEYFPPTLFYPMGQIDSFFMFLQHLFEKRQKIEDIILPIDFDTSVESNCPLAHP